MVVDPLPDNIEQQNGLILNCGNQNLKYRKMHGIKRTSDQKRKQQGSAQLTKLHLKRRRKGKLTH